MASYSGRQHLPVVVTQTVMMIIFLAQWKLGTLPWFLAAGFGVIWIAAVVVIVFEAVARRRLGTVLELNATGVTVIGHPIVPWKDLSGISITRLASRWLTFGRDFDVAAFIPRDGVILPDLPLPPLSGPSMATIERARSARQRQFGSTLVVNPALMSIGTADLVSAVQTWSDLSTDRRPPPRRLRLMLTVVPAVLLAVVIVILLVAVWTH